MHSDTLEGFQLSPQQRHLWSLQQTVQNQPYLTQCLLLLEGPLDPPILQKALRDVVSRHEILRTSFRRLPGITTPLQFIADESTFSLSEYDFSMLEAPEQECKVEALALEARSRSLDFAVGPLLSASLVALAPHRHLLLLTSSAFCADGPTLKNLMEETSRACSGGAVYSDEPLQYADLSEWQNELLRGEDAETELAYWRKLDRSQLTAMHVPFGQGLEKLQNLQQDRRFTPQILTIPLEAAFFPQITALAQQCERSLADLLLTCWRILLSRFTGVSDLVIGATCDGRHYQQLTSALGPYARVIPLSVALPAGCTFKEAVILVGSSLAKSIERQEYFTWEALHEQEEPFVPLGFEFEDWPTFSVGKETRFTIQYSYSCLDRFVLKLAALRAEERLCLSLHYDPLYLSAEQAGYLGSCLLALLRDAITRPQTFVDALALLDAREQQRLLQTYAPPTVSYSFQPVHHLFEVQASQRGSDLAVICGQEQLTYQQLNTRANQLAHFLREQGVAPNALVALCLPRSFDLLIALLAVLKAGGAYIPLDPDHPPARLCWQLQDLTPHVLLTHESLRSRFADWHGSMLCLDQAQHLLHDLPRHDPQVAISPDNLAYLIYTSGSTGQPKGVMISHGGLSHYVQWSRQCYEVVPGSCSIVHTSLAFDLTITSFFPALVSGGSVLLAREEPGIEGLLAALGQAPEQHLLKITPAHLDLLKSACSSQDRAWEAQVFVIGGEALWAEQLEDWRQQAPATRLINEYGPTETVVGCCVYEVRAEDAHTGSVPIGRPIANTQIYLLDGAGQLVPWGVLGEIYIGGASMAHGYVKQPEQTAERFVPHPFSPEPGARLYRTGDLGRYREDGQLEYVGRRDEQVKVRGYRIELGEIEAVLREHSAVAEVVVVARQGEEEGARQLVAYVVGRATGEDGVQSTSQQLREFVRERLPEYMVPAEVIWLERLPLTANGKVDRASLSTSVPLAQEQAGTPEEARTPVEEVMVGVWQEVLNLRQVGRNDNFFHLGGHSLLGMKLISRLRVVFGVEVPITWVFEAPTVAQLASRVEGLLRGQEHQLIPPIEVAPRMEVLPLSFAQQRLWFLDQLVPGTTAYLVPSVLRVQGPVHSQALEQSLQEMIRRHEILRTTFEERDGQPIQVIHPVAQATAFQLPLVDLESLSKQERQEEVRRFASQERQRPFDLACSPLLRTWLLRLAPEEHVLLLTLHHIITDGWSNIILQRELRQLYQAFEAGEPSPLPPLPIQYADYALWQRNWLQGRELEAQLDYWILQLSGAPPLKLPLDYPRPAVPGHRGAFHVFDLSEELSQSLLSLCRTQNVTLFMTLLAAFQVLLYRYTGQKDIVLGTDSANRNRIETENLIGFFINLLVLRVKLDENPSFREVLRRVREVVLGAYTHNETPFDLLVRKLMPDHALDRMPLVQALFVLQNLSEPVGQSVPSQEKRALETVPESVMDREIAVKFDLAVFMRERAGRLYGSVSYSLDLFSATTISTMMGRFKALLQSAVQQLDVSIDQLDMFTQSEHIQQEQEERALREELPSLTSEWFDLPGDDFSWFE